MDPTYNDDDLVYVDPETRSVVGKVEWGPDGKPKSLLRPEPEDEEGKKKRHKPRFYPWGTYRSMKRIYNIEGKVTDSTSQPLSLDEAMKKASKEPFWD